MGLNLSITCKCGHTFKSDDAEMCKGHYIVSCGCRSADDSCLGDVLHYTLACPSCGKCVCDKMYKWVKSGKMVPVDDERFEFVHKDYLPTSKVS